MTVNVDNLRAQYRQKVAAADALMAQFKGREHEMPQEIADQINGLLGEADGLKARIEMSKQLAGHQDYLEEPAGTKAAHLGWRQAGPGEGDVPVDEKAWREVTIDTPFGTKTVRYHVPLAVQAKGYDSAFEAYLRKGASDLGPQDRKTLSEGVDSAGGFLVPPDYHTELIKKIATMAAIRPLARVIQTSRDVAQWPRVNYATDDRYTSGVRLTWTGEMPASGLAHRVTDPVFGMINIPVHTAMASMPLSNNLIEDAAFDVLGIASDMMAEAFALGEDDCFINGTGVNQPMGILADVDGSGPASVLSGTNGAISTEADVHSAARMLDLFYAVPAQYRRRATWVMNSQTLKEVENLVDGMGRPLVTSLMTGGAIFNPAPDVIKGRPVAVDEFMPDIAQDDYPIIFGDLSGYIIVDRVALSVQRLDEVYAEQNIVLLLGRKRVGGYCAEPYRIKVMKASAS